MNERPQYRSDQGVSIRRLPVLIGGMLLVVVVVAWVFKVLFFHNLFFVKFAPLAGGAVLGIATALLVQWSHCRNRWLAAGLAAVGAAAIYLGYFYFCMIETLPAGNAARIDLLPRYIEMRLKTDVKHQVPGPHKVNLQEAFPVLNLLTLILEVLASAGLAAFFAQRPAARAYCSALGQWMREEATLFPAYFGPQLQRALADDCLDQLVAMRDVRGPGDVDVAVKTARMNDSTTACRFVLEYGLPAEESPLAYPVYASIEDLPTKRSWRPWSDALFRKTLMRQVVLSTHEVLSVCPLFPKLSEALRLQHAALKDLPLAPPPIFGAIGSTTDVARITPVPAAFRRRVRSPAYALKVNLWDLLPLAVAALGGGLLGCGGYLVSQGAIIGSVAPFALGACGVAWGLYCAGYCMSVNANRWIDRRLRAEIALRPDALVSPHDPDAVYASLIPRENWERVQLTMSSDLLLLNIDATGRQVLLEGDCDRYQIPAGAIAECEPECFFHPLDSARRRQLWTVRMTIRAEEGLRELLLAIHFTDFWPFTNARRKQTAQEACQQINGLRSVGPAS